MRAFIFLSLLSLVKGYHILCFQTIPSRSHYYMMMGIVHPLLEAGHEVTLATAYPDSKPVKNLHIIDVSDVKMALEGINVLDGMALTTVRVFARQVSEIVMTSPAVRKALVDTNFDAVVTEWFMSDVEAGYAAVQQVPWIVLLGTVMNAHLEYLTDTMRSISTLPIIVNDQHIPMTFWQRIKNTLFCVHMGVGEWMEYSSVESSYIKNFGPLAEERGITLPPYGEALHNISVLFVNSHPSISPAWVLPPNVVHIGGYHIREDTTPLPQDLQKLLDSSTQGVIYFSMGTVIQDDKLPEKIKLDFVRVFSELPYTVLWKFNAPIENLPKNVHVRKWLPQTKILAHPNVKLFITHCGLLSTMESINYGVPILTMPVFADQLGNADRAVEDGYALKIKYSPDMSEELSAALKEMTSNNSYYNRAKALSAVFRNRLATPDKVVQHYIELAIQSKGAPHLRSKAPLYRWYELWMLDQLAFLMTILYILYRIIKTIAHLLYKKNIYNNKLKKKL